VSRCFPLLLDLPLCRVRGVSIPSTFFPSLYLLLLAQVQTSRIGCWTLLHSLSLLYTEWSALNVLTHLAFFDPLTKSTVALQQQYFSIFFFSLLQPTVYDPAWTKPHCPSPLRRVSVALFTLVDFSSHLQRCSVVAPFLYFIFLLHPLYFIPSFSSSCHLQHNPRGARISTFL